MCCEMYSHSVCKGLGVLSHRGPVSEFSLVSHTLFIHCFHEEQKKCVWLHITLTMDSAWELHLTVCE